MPVSLLPATPAASLLAPPAPKPLPAMREFGDAKATRQSIYDATLKAAQELEPLADDKHTLRLTDVAWVDPDRFTRRQRKQAVLTGETLARRMQGTWSLLDNATGKPIQTRKQVIARVPYLSSAGTFTHRGTEYSVINQQRLKPGVFARVKDNGELESHVNVMPGKGVSHRYFLDPEKGIFKIRMHQAEMPLMPLLQAMGATDKELREAWGNDLAAANAAKNDSGVVQKLKQKLLRRDDLLADNATSTQRLVERFTQMELDPEVTQRTLGHPYARLDKAAILAATRKLLAVSRKEAEPDDRDALPYQNFLGPEDLFAERISRDHGGARRGVFKKISFSGKLDGMPSGLLTPQLEDVLLGSGLGQCFDAETYVLTKRGWLLWSAVLDDDEFACRIGGQLVYAKASRVFRYDYVGEMFGCRTKRFSYLVTPNHRLWCRTVRGEYRCELASAAHGFTRYFETSLPVAANTIDDDFFLPAVINRRWGKSTGCLRLPGDAWAQFLGWYISEGWLSVEKKKQSVRRRVCLCQCPKANPDGWAAIAAVLSSLPFKWTFNSSNNTFFIDSKQLFTELAKCGATSGKKRIPRYCFSWSARRLRLLASAYMRGDGNDYHGYEKAETTSHGLAMDLVELFGRLGGTGRISFRELSKKNENWADSHVISYSHSNTTHAQSDATAASRQEPIAYFKQAYAGKVYCAAVPGEMLYVMRDGKPHWSLNSLEEINPIEIFDKQSRVTRMGVGGIPSTDSVPDEARSVQPSHTGFIDLLRTPESFAAGIVLNMSRASRKGSDGQLYTQMRDPATNKTVWKTPREVSESVLTWPGVLTSKEWQGSNRIPVLRNGEFAYAKKSDVDYVLPDFEDSFSPLGNLVPFKSMVKGQRVAMASRMLTQALPLNKGEAPLVRSALPENLSRSFEEEYGKHAGAVTADQAGRVLDIRDGVVRVKYADGKVDDIELYENFPFNRKTLWNQTPTVKPGDAFQKGDLLVRSNYTDDKGALALGLNARVAYIPWEGYNFEDAVVISESAAKRFSSEHAYQHGLEATDKHKIGKGAFVSLFPGKFDREALKRLDDRGVIKPGTEVSYGDPLILAAKERDRAQNKIHKKRQAGYNDASVLWEHHDPGVVTDVAWGKHGPIVVVKSIASMQVGDKMSARYGDKGVVSAIVPDADMPQDRDGNPFEVLLSPLGVISRTNPAQMVESALGKIAAKTGKPYIVPDFQNDKDMTAWAQEELRKHGMDDMEDVWLPKQNTRVKVATGNRFLMKLHHSAESKAQGRSSGGYTMDETPSKGGYSGCFVGDTPVAVARQLGNPVDAVRVPINELVHSKFSGYAILPRADGTVRAESVVDWFHRRVPATDLVTITLESGESFSCTSGHEIILADGSRVDAGNLTVGDNLAEAL